MGRPGPWQRPRGGPSGSFQVGPEEEALCSPARWILSGPKSLKYFLSGLSHKILFRNLWVLRSAREWRGRGLTAGSSVALREESGMCLASPLPSVKREDGNV